MLVEWFVFGGLTYWIITAIISCLVLATVSTDSGGWATALTVLFGIFTIGFTNLSNPFVWIVANPLLAVTYLGAYYLIGVAYAYFKWIRYCYSAKAEYLEGKALGSKESKNYWQPKASKHKSTIVTWLAYWPFSFVGMFVYDIIHNVFVAIYNRIAGSFQKISDKIWADVT